MRWVGEAPAAALASVLLVAGGASGQQPVRPLFPVPVEVATRADAVLLPVGDGLALVYELVVANPSPKPLLLERIVVRSGGTELATWEGARLAALMKRLPPEERTEEDALLLKPGDRHLVYFWIESPEVRPGLAPIVHDVTVRGRGLSDLMWWTARSAPRPVEPVELVIDPPVRGGRWLVGNGFANDTDHRRFLTASGGLFIPQRFGADFLKLDEGGDNATAERPLHNEVFHAFDEPLYAVADGEVVVVRQGLPDNPAGSTPSGLAWDALPGNHVVVRIADDVYALYAHLRDGSIMVREGESITRGQPIARIGNSGNTSAPHLHFHLMRGTDPNLSEGVPFAFSSFEVLVRDYRFAPDQRPIPSEGSRVTHGVPRLRWVVAFSR